jgi:hypothetical protein
LSGGSSSLTALMQKGKKWCQQWLASCWLSHPFGTRKNGRSSPSSARKNGHVLSGAE